MKPKMKRLNKAESELIADFLKAAREKKIIAVDDWKPGQEPGPAALAFRSVQCALQGILDGQDPDQALWLTRKTGRPTDRYKEILAIEIRDWKLSGDAWKIIVRKANNWRAERQLPAVSIDDLKKINAKYRKEIAPLTEEEAAEIDGWVASQRRN